MKRYLIAAVLALCAYAPCSAQQFETVAVHLTPPDATNWKLEFRAGRMHVENLSVRDLIKTAYGLSADSQVMSAPPWTTQLHFDMDGTVDAATSKTLDSAPYEQRELVIGALMRSLLKERFGLSDHEATVPLAVYALTVARGGVKAQPYAENSSVKFHGIVGRPGKLDAHGASMNMLASRLTSLKDADGRLVMDETGLQGTYDWTLRWSPDQLNANAASGDAPFLFAALEEQLGLKLISAKRQVRAIVVEAVTKPSDN
jgi:uncharacterized protein (TIGR03435 family)